jgi:threonine dehydratase
MVPSDPDIRVSEQRTTDNGQRTVGYEDILAAAERIAPWVHRTPVMTSRTIDGRCGGTVFFKCENFQKVGAFKFRGAVNALLQLGEAGRRAGVVTHSSGNHAQALALAGKLLGVPVTVVMPRTAPAVKREATEGYGARVVPCEPTLADREATVAAEIERHGLSLVHPFNDWNVIAGQGTAALELLDQAGPLDLILCPVGGGGLLSGTALAGKGRSPRTPVIGAEPARADDARRSLETGSIQPSDDPHTIADGLRTSLGPFTFAVISRDVDQIVTATEAEIVEAMRFVWERMKILIEPSSAVPVATLWNGQLDVKGLRVGVIISGGNVDVEPVFRALAAKFLT